MKRALATALLALAASSALAAAQHSEGGGHTVSIGFGDFAPSHLDVLVGDTVTWRNDSVRQHTVTADDESWDSGRLGARAVFRRRFDQPGRVGYYCRLHVIAASLDVHSVLLEESHSAGDPGLPRDLSGRAAAEPGSDVQIEADTGAGFVPAATVAVEAGRGLPSRDCAARDDALPGRPRLASQPPGHRGGARPAGVGVGSSPGPAHGRERQRHARLSPRVGGPATAARRPFRLVAGRASRARPSLAGALLDRPGSPP